MNPSDDKEQSAFIVAAPSSSSGKTTVALGLMAAIKARGIQVQPFKAGPDYIDPAHHKRICERPSYNLDTWMMGDSPVKETFARAMEDTRVGIVEGVMGLFDGKGGGLAGSTAELSKALDIKVILVVNAKGMAGSVAAIIKGFEEFDEEVKLAGIILNKVGSERHFLILKEAIEANCKSPVLGYLPRDESIAIGERHLGLLGTGESNIDIAALAEMITTHVDIDELIKVTAIEEKDSADRVTPATLDSVSIAVAQDKAFLFYYQENLEMLEALGAKLLYFSPIADYELPPTADAIYLGGGYPELYASELEANKTMRRAIKEFAESGRPIYAECGGLIYLGESITTKEDETFEMAGVLPIKGRMLDRRKSLGYREVKVQKGSPFMDEGETIRGHEFHYSEIELLEEIKKVRTTDKDELEGLLYKKTLASYIHLHFASNTKFAEGFIEAARKCQPLKG